MVYNYAREIENAHGKPVVVTPEYPGVDDSACPFPVIRYPSIDITKKLKVTAGIPFSPEAFQQLMDEKVELMHVHCPASTALLARALRSHLDVPLVMTYHTKCDVDISKVIKMKLLSDNVISAMVENISAYDEVWAVSRGAGENLRSLGYQNDYIIMPNGVDLPHERVSDSTVEQVTGSYNLPSGVPVFLFVGRFMWYKGIRIIVDALAGLESNGYDFRMIFIGDGTDAAEIIDYIEKTGIMDKCIFTGPVHDRETLRAWYCRADLMLFPSTFDTNGLVVREAAACSLPTVLVRDSAAAEGITDGQNGYLIAENAVSLAVKLTDVCRDMNALHRVGENAGNEIYLSWKDAVARAADRYEIVLDNYRSGKYPKHRKVSDGILNSMGELMSFMSRFPGLDRNENGMSD